MFVHIYVCRKYDEERQKEDNFVIHVHSSNNLIASLEN